MLENKMNIEKTRLTLHIITNEDNFSNSGEVGEKRDIISNFYLGGFINDNSVKRSPPKDTLPHQSGRREHAQSTKHNWAAIEFREPLLKFPTSDDIGPDGGIKMLMPRGENHEKSKLDTKNLPKGIELIRNQKFPVG
jgi:hypothetical protein